MSPANPSTSAGESKTCPRCQGRGWIDSRCSTPDQAHRCPHCNGKGFTDTGRECYACHGTGLIEVRQADKNPCPTCRGAGVFPVPATMTKDDYAYKPNR